MQTYAINGKTWQVEPSFFDDCLDYIRGDDIVTIKEYASDRQIVEALGEDDRHEYIGNYRYRMRDTRRGDTLGPCEVCLKQCSNPHIFVEQELTRVTWPNGRTHQFYKTTKIIFGHPECLDEQKNK